MHNDSNKYILMISIRRYYMKLFERQAKVGFQDNSELERCVDNIL